VTDVAGADIDTFGIFDVVRWDAVLRYQGGEVTGVARVVSTNHDHDVQLSLQQRQDRVLTLLGGGADGVEGPKVLVQSFGAIAADDALPNLFRYGKRLAGEHGCLVSQSHPSEVPLEIEPWGDCLTEPGLELGDTASMLDKVTDEPSFVLVEHDEISTARMLHHLAGGRLGFFVVVLAMDDGGVTIAGIALHPLPHVQDRSTRGVYQNAANGAEPLEVPDGDAKRRHDHDVFRGNLAEIEVPILTVAQKRDPHLGELLIDMGIMDDLSNEKESAVGKLGPGLIGVLYRAIDAIAESELSRQPERQRPDPELILVGFERLHDGAVVVGGQPTGDLALETESFAEVRLLHSVNVHWCPRPQQQHSDLRMTQRGHTQEGPIAESDSESFR
jgi:hypothetical protein